VNSTDYLSLLNEYNVRDNSSSFGAWADSDGNVKIDSADYLGLLNNYNNKFTGFTPTI
jgi:hypothetical protein